MRSRFVGITGPSGSGKSTLAEAVCATHGNAVIVQQDWYFRNAADCPPEANFCEPRWLHVNELVRDVARLSNGMPTDVPVMDFATFERRGTKSIAPAPLVILEGMTILRIPELDALLAARFYVDCDLATIAARKRSRDTLVRQKSVEIVNAQLDWIAKEYLADEEIRQREDVTVLSYNVEMAVHVRAILA